MIIQGLHDALQQYWPALIRRRAAGQRRSVEEVSSAISWSMESRCVEKPYCPAVAATAHSGTPQRLATFLLAPPKSFNCSLLFSSMRHSTPISWLSMKRQDIRPQTTRCLANQTARQKCNLLSVIGAFSLLQAVVLTDNNGRSEFTVVRCCCMNDATGG